MPAPTPRRRRRSGRKRVALAVISLLLAVAVAAGWYVSGRYEFYTTRGYLRYELFSGTFVLSIPIVGWQDSTRWHVTDKRLGFGPFSTPQPATWLWRTVPPERDPLLWPKPESIDLAVVCCTYYPSSGTRSIAVVLWPIPPLLVACSALLLRSGILARRRSKAGCCTACGYDLTGLGAGAACPECGNAHPLRP